MAWAAVILGGLVLWAGCGAVYALGREVWPGEMPEVVRFAVAPAIATAATVGNKLVSPDFQALATAAGFTAIVAALDALVLAPVVDGDRAMFGRVLGAWAPLAAIFAASLLTGVFAPT